MKRSDTVVAVVPAVVLAFLLGNGCAGTSAQYVSGSEFIRRAGQRPTTLTNSELIGVSLDRVYLEHWSKRPIWGEHLTVVWTPLVELPAEAVAELKVGRNPWDWRATTRPDWGRENRPATAASRWWGGATP